MHSMPINQTAFMNSSNSKASNVEAGPLPLPRLCLWPEASQTSYQMSTAGTCPVSKVARALNSSLNSIQHQDLVCKGLYPYKPLWHGTK